VSCRSVDAGSVLEMMRHAAIMLQVHCYPKLDTFDFQSSIGSRPYHVAIRFNYNTPGHSHPISTDSVASPPLVCCYERPGHERGSSCVVGRERGAIDGVRIRYIRLRGTFSHRRYTTNRNTNHIT
jgi:hypothetical protein